MRRFRFAIALIGPATLLGCSGGERAVVEPAPPAISRGAGNDCFEAWNAAGNVRNRIAVARDYRSWSLEVTEVEVSHPAEGLTGSGCSYVLHSSSRWIAFNGMWERDGDFVWEASPSRGPKTDELIRPPNAVVLAQGGIAPLSSSNAVTPDEWRAVIDDWYGDGRIDAVHSCAAVKQALAALPQDVRDFSTAHADLADHAREVC